MMASQDNIRCARCSVVVLDLFSRIIQELIDFNTSATRVYQKIMKTKTFFDNLDCSQKKSINTLQSEGNFKQLDFSLIYKIAKFFKLYIDPPTRGWRAKPSSNETSIGDDVERMRRARNKLFHKVEATIDETEFNNFFTTFVQVGKRVDEYLSKPNNYGYEKSIRDYKTSHLDTDIAEKYLKERKEKEQLKALLDVRVPHGKTVHVLVGNTAMEAIEKVRKIEDDGTTSLKFIIHGIEDSTKQSEMLTALVNERNIRTENIEFVSATSECIALYVNIKNTILKDGKEGKQFQSEVSTFIQKLLMLEDIKYIDDEKCNLIITSAEEDIHIDYSEAAISEEMLETDDPWCGDDTLVMNLRVKNKALKTEDTLRENIEEFVGNLLSHTNGQELIKKDEVTAILTADNEKDQIDDTGEELQRNQSFDDRAGGNSDGSIEDHHIDSTDQIKDADEHLQRKRSFNDMTEGNSDCSIEYADSDLGEVPANKKRNRTECQEDIDITSYSDFVEVDRTAKTANKVVDTVKTDVPNVRPRLGGTISTEEYYYLCISKLLFNVAYPAVRKKFDEMINPLSLMETLNKRKLELGELLRKGQIGNSQWKLLFPNKGITSSSTFDVTLMIHVIAKLNSMTKVSRQCPDDNDSTTEADLSRILFYRDKVRFNDEKILTREQFTRYWNGISVAVIRLGGPSFINSCAEYNVDSSQYRGSDSKSSNKTAAIETANTVQIGREKDEPNAFRHKRSVYKMIATEEEMNYLRLSHLLFKEAPAAVRVYFNTEFHPTVLKTTLGHFRYKLQKLRQNHINRTRWDLLYPRSGKPSSDTFDFPLMMCLLRNLVPILIGDQLPRKECCTKEDDLSRIQFYRKELQFTEIRAVSNEYIKHRWKDISMAIIRLGGASFKQRCVNQDFAVQEETDMLYQSIPKGVKQIHTKKIKEWSCVNMTVMEIDVFTQVAKLLEQQSLLVVTGSFGCGKSITIRNVAIKFEEENGYEIVPVHSPIEMLLYHNTEKRQIFVFDDVCGKYTADIHKMNAWNDLSGDVLDILSQSQIKILVSSRLHIFKTKEFQKIKLFIKTSVNLSTDNALSSKEMERMAQTYRINKKAERLFGKYGAFPLCCMYYSSAMNLNPYAIMKSLFEREFLAILEEIDMTTFCILFLFVVYNNNISDEIISTQTLKPVLDKISDYCQMPSSFSLSVVTAGLCSLEGSYVKRTDTGFTMLDDVLFGAFISICGKNVSDLVLKLGHRDVCKRLESL